MVATASCLGRRPERGTQLDSAQTTCVLFFFLARVLWDRLASPPGLATSARRGYGLVTYFHFVNRLLTGLHLQWRKVSCAPSVRPVRYEHWSLKEYLSC